MQAGLSYLDADSFPLPHGFQDFKNVPTDTGDSRENAQRRDRKFSVKLGLTPNATDEYAIGYVRQEGEKGNPVYTGRATSGVRYWRWPWWDKDSVYFIGNTAFGDHNVVKLRAYHDSYGNGLQAYSNGTYATELLNTSFPSIYDDKTHGASIEWINTAADKHELHVAFHYKQDKHLESNPKSPDKGYRDVTLSLALEDVIHFNDASQLRLGLSREKRDAREVYFWPTGSTEATNGLAELLHTMDDGSQWHASVSRKTRFPTIKDRYSARMGSALPNPDLKPERATHLEFGWRGKPWKGVQVDANVFQSRITDRIQSVVVASTSCGGSYCDQAQNIGVARHRGIELAVEQQWGDAIRIGGNYTWLDRENLSNPVSPLTDTPKQKLFAHASIALGEQWELLATLDAESGRLVSFSGPSKIRELGSFASVGTTVAWHPRDDLTVEAGVKNLGDKWYELADGYPMAGRNWFVNTRWRF